jgi:hypothetical protein
MRKRVRDDEIPIDFPVDGAGERMGRRDKERAPRVTFGIGEPPDQVEGNDDQRQGDEQRQQSQMLAQG